MPQENDPYERAGLALVLSAMLFLILAFLGAGPTVVPLLIVSSLGLFLTGILLLTFTRGQSPDPAVFSFLEVQHQANLATLLSRAGSRDPPVFIPYGELEGRVGQFHALPSGSPLCHETGGIPASHRGRTGIILPPACLPLVKELQTRFHLKVPADPGRLPLLLEEVAGEILEIADQVTTTVEPGEIRVDLAGFAFYPGCRAAAAGTQDACLLSPCTFCSLIACLAVRATGRECQVVSMDLDDRLESVHLVLSFHPQIREVPAVAAPALPVSGIPEDAVIPVPAPLESPATGVPVVLAMEETVSPVPGGPEAPVVTEQASPVPDTFSMEIPGKPEVPPWWNGHPGTRRLRYLGIDEGVSPVLEVVSLVPPEAISRVPEEMVSPVTPEMVVPEIAERGYLSMEELVARATKDLVSPVKTEPAASPVEKPIAPPMKEPTIIFPEETKSHGLQELPSGVMEWPVSPVPIEPESTVSGEREAPEPGGPSIPIVEEPESTAWWSRHPGSRRVRYLREEGKVIPVKGGPGIPVPAEALPGPGGKKPGSPGSRMKQSTRKRKEKQPGPVEEKPGSPRSRRTQSIQRREKEPPG